MKFFALAALAITSVAAWSQDACPTSELNKLVALAAVPELQQCQDDSTYTFIPPSNAPDDAQVALMCASQACNATITALVALQPADCVLSFSNGVSLNVLELVTELVPTCAAA